MSIPSVTLELPDRKKCSMSLSDWCIVLIKYVVSVVTGRLIQGLKLVGSTKTEHSGKIRSSASFGRDCCVAHTKNRGFACTPRPGARAAFSRHLSNLLWCDRGEQQARNSLRQALNALNKSAHKSTLQLKGVFCYLSGSFHTASAMNRHSSR